MSATPPPRTRARATPARANNRADRPHGPGSALITAAQILLGLTLSCMLAVLSFIALGAVILLIIYLAK